jgi:hypothetical protein
MVLWFAGPAMLGPAKQTAPLLILKIWLSSKRLHPCSRKFAFTYYPVIDVARARSFWGTFRGKFISLMQRATG